MNENDDQRALVRLGTLRQERRAESLTVLLTSSAVGQLLFASFAFGHSRGPLRMRWAELGGGMAAVLVGSLILSTWLARRRRRQMVEWRATVTEGDKKRAVEAFEGYVMVSDEIILPETVHKAEVEEERLVLRYRDPRVGGPVLRELSGAPQDLRRLAAWLARDAQAS